MQGLLSVSKLIDRWSNLVGSFMKWLILGSTVVSAVNAIVRKAFDIGSNAFLEIQWYFFATSFLLAAGYTLLNNEHVRIDVISGKFSKRGQTWIDIFGLVCFLIPVCLAIIWFSTPLFLQAYRSHEVSANAGGLTLWPIYMMLPLGFAFLLLQAISELIKRFAFLRGLIADPTMKHIEKSAEEELAEAIRLRTEAAEAALLAK